MSSFFETKESNNSVLNFLCSKFGFQKSYFSDFARELEDQEPEFMAPDPGAASTTMSSSK